MNSQPEWMQWLDQAPMADSETEPPTAAVVPLRGGTTAPTPDAPTAGATTSPLPRQDRDKAPAWLEQAATPAPLVLVTGAGGGAGATTTAVGIAGAWAVAETASAVVVDLTVAGGDLGVRTGTDERAPAIDALAGAGDPATIVASLPVSSAGARIIDRGEQRFDELPVQQMADILWPRVDTVVYDLGPAALRLRECATLREDPNAVFVLVVQARADAFNRLRGYLDLLAAAAGEGVFDRTVVVISHQNSTEPDVDPAELIGHLSPLVRAVEEVPYDPHLATGLTISSWELRAATVDAYARIQRATAAAEDRER
ncbi:MAG: hypothetical protein WAW17_26915 [Rhodococcus sp. (in: high G+C Gram-positive bacteria)]|uniref:hypothetical protein n=1 Tax=Rhodococcus sp. TaxID=1831 RepID=UPI003BB12FA2